MNAETSSLNWKKTGWIAGSGAAAAGMVAFVVNLTTIAGWFGVGPEAEADEREGTTVAAQYVSDCEDDGYSREQCERSRDLDPSPEWTGTLYEDDGGETTDGPDGSQETDGPEETGEPEPEPREVYLQECRDDGYGPIDCEVSWEHDPGTEWTGTLYGPYDSYVRDCQADGYTWDDCDVSWQYDPGTEWTGTLYTAPTEYDVYVQDCQNDGYDFASCDSSWYNDPNNYWSGQLY